MATEYLLYGLRQGETERYMEELLFTSIDESKLDAGKEIAHSHGFHSFRTAEYKVHSKPDFGNTLNI